MSNESKNKSAEKRAKSILDFYFEVAPDAVLDERIRQWLVDPQNRQEKDDALEQVWNERFKGCDTPGQCAYDALEKIHARLGSPEQCPARKTRLLRRKVYWVAAAVILFGGISAALFHVWNRPADSGTHADVIIMPDVNVKMSSISVENEGCCHVVLPDNSEVWVRRGGMISFPEDFSIQRTVHLEGEAYFSVVKQDGKLFSVTGDDMIINVLGTEFYAKAGNDAPCEVTLVEGAVEATVGGLHVAMKPGDNLHYDDDIGEMVLRQADLSEVAQWRYKYTDLVFTDTPMDEVFRRISNYFNVTIAIDDKLPLDKTITVAIDRNEPLDEVLFIVKNTVGDFDYSIRGTNMVEITGNRQ